MNIKINKMFINDAPPPPPIFGKKTVSISTDLVLVETVQVSPTDYISNYKIVNLQTGTIDDCPFMIREDVIILNDNNHHQIVQIDTKNLTVTVPSRALVVCLKESVEKIYNEDAVGCADLYEDTLLLTVKRKKESKEGEKPSSLYTHGDLGETLEGVDQVELLTVDLLNGVIKFLDTPTLIVLKAVLTPNQVIFTAMPEDRVLGVVHCNNKPIFLYAIDRQTGTVRLLDDNYCYGQGLFHDADRLNIVYLKARLGGAHYNYSKICTRSSVDGFANELVVLDQLVGQRGPLGIIPRTQTPTRYFHLDVECSFYRRILRVDLKEKTMKFLSDPNESWSILHVLSDDTLLVQGSAIGSAPILGCLKNGAFVWRHPIQGPYKAELLFQKDTSGALLVKADNYSDGRNKAVVMMIHGGPNGNYVDEYDRLSWCLLKHGISICKVNYTGSSGYGQKGIDALMGRVGEADLEDCNLVYNLLNEKFENVHLYGGSHGGYLAAKLACQVENVKSCILLNPVINVWMNAVYCDIPDYYYCGYYYGCIDHDWRDPITRNDLELFHSVSPNIKSAIKHPPCLIFLGGKDVRVPCVTNGLVYRRWLVKQGIFVKCHLFPDLGHALKSGEAEYTMLADIVDFVRECS